MKYGNMVRIQIQFTEEQFDVLQSEHERTGAPIAEITRRAVMFYFAHRNTLKLVDTGVQYTARASGNPQEEK